MQPLSTKYFYSLFVGLFLSVSVTSAQSVAKYSYAISMPDPKTHDFKVRLIVKNVVKDSLDLKMPVWMPGYYQILDYAAAVDSFTVNEKSTSIAWRKVNNHTWRIAVKNKPQFSVHYTVHASKQFVANPYLDTTRGYIAPAGIFLYPDKQLLQPVAVTVVPYKKWQNVATGLEPVKGKKNQFTATDFDVLYDSPILVGDLTSLPTFYVKGIPHYFTGYDIGKFDSTAFINDLQKIVAAGVKIIGDIPYSHYTFLAIGPGRGGIEHLNSTTISFDGDGLNTPGGKLRLYSFIAHEYFHHYNVKRIRPFDLGPFDYEKENRTNMLWISEGLTVYYEYLLVKRAGLMSDAELYKSFENNIKSFQPGKKYQSLTQASWETWSDGPFGRTGDSVIKTISYYDKGPVVGLLLDFAIRHATQNKRSLDDVMRYMYQHYYQQAKRGFKDPEFQAACEKIAGVKLDELFSYVGTTNELDYNKYLGYAGLQLDTQLKIVPLSKTDALQDAMLKSWKNDR